MDYLIFHLQELGVASFCPSAAKKRRMEVEVSEEGVMELCVQFYMSVPGCSSIAFTIDQYV